MRISKGMQLALLTALISGVSIFINKFAVMAIKPPLMFTASKNFGVALLIIGLLIATAKWKKIAVLTKSEIGKLVAIGVIGGTVPFYLFFTGLAMTGAVNANLINKTLVIWVAIIAIPFLKEKLTAKHVMAILLLFGANAYVGGFKGFQFNQGELMILGATLFWAVEYVIAKKVLATVDPDLVTGARMGLGSVLLMAAAYWQHPQAVAQIGHLNQTQWMWMGATMVSLLVYVMIWYRALKYAKAITVTTVLVAATLVTNVLSAIFVDHSLKTEMIYQGLVMMVGVGMVVWAERERTTVELVVHSAQ